ncbi:MAG: DUF4381 domain-containing protein [Magnetococcus sp. XQGC-1]
MELPAPALELRDIHLPEPISWWPPAPGWWAVLAAVGLCIVVAIFFWHRHRQTRLRRAALAELERLLAAHAEQPDLPRLTGGLSALLRRVCLAAPWLSGAGEPAAAGLTGVAWLEFLERFLPEKPFTCGVGQWLIATPFQRADTNTPVLSDAALAELIALCRSWLQLHSVPGRRIRSSS